MKKQTKIIKLSGFSLILVTVISATFFVFNFVFAQTWQGPLLPPPDGNTPGVIFNKSAADPAQAANINLSDLDPLIGNIFADIIESPNFISSTINTDTIYTKEVCLLNNINGANCRTNWPSGGGDFWQEALDFGGNSRGFIYYNKVQGSQVDDPDLSSVWIYDGEASTGQNNPTGKIDIRGIYTFSGGSKNQTWLRLVAESDFTATEAHSDIVWGDDSLTELNFVYDQWNAAPITIMTLLPSGNVGIGTTNPGAPLEVKSQTGVTEDPIVKFASTDGRSLQLLDADNANNNDPFTWQTSNAITWRIDSADRMTLNASGRLGIGTASPAYKLDVQEATSGKTRALNVKLNNGNTDASHAAYFENTTIPNPANIYASAIGIEGVGGTKGVQGKGSIGTGGWGIPANTGARAIGVHGFVDAVNSFGGFFSFGDAGGNGLFAESICIGDPDNPGANCISDWSQAGGGGSLSISNITTVINDTQILITTTSIINRSNNSSAPMSVSVSAHPFNNSFAYFEIRELSGGSWRLLSKWTKGGSSGHGYDVSGTFWVPDGWEYRIRPSFSTWIKNLIETTFTGGGGGVGGFWADAGNGNIQNTNSGNVDIANGTLFVDSSSVTEGADTRPDAAIVFKDKASKIYIDTGNNLRNLIGFTGNNNIQIGAASGLINNVNIFAGNNANDPGAIRFFPNGNEAMRVHTNANVGINNTTPAYRLDVLESTSGRARALNVRLNNGNTDASHAAYFENTTIPNPANIYASAIGIEGVGGTKGVQGKGPIGVGGWGIPASVGARAIGVHGFVDAVNSFGGFFQFGAGGGNGLFAESICIGDPDNPGANCITDWSQAGGGGGSSGTVALAAFGALNDNPFDGPTLRTSANFHVPEGWIGDPGPFWILTSPPYVRIDCSLSVVNNKPVMRVRQRSINSGGGVTGNIFDISKETTKMIVTRASGAPADMLEGYCFLWSRPRTTTVSGVITTEPSFNITQCWDHPVSGQVCQFVELNN